MKTLLISISLLLLATACDSPQRNRIPVYGNMGNTLGQPAPSTTTTNPWTTSTTGTTGTSSGGAATAPKPAGFENCDITPSYLQAAGINYIGICQSTLDETAVAVKPTVTDSVRTCMIPTYKDNAGNSTYLGRPQCFAPQENIVTVGQLQKTRAGFTASPLNGVMIMKEGSLTAYFTCMDAYIGFTHPQCPYGAKTNGYCDQMAKSIMTTKCNNFKTDHSYIDVCLKKPHGLCY